MDTTRGLSRRRFVGTALEATALVAAAGVIKPLTALTGEPESGVVLYDPRFTAAKALATELGRGSRLAEVAGDPTDLVLALAAREKGVSLPCVRGVTTESVPFCLLALMPGAKLTQRRHDRDLFVWTLEAQV